MITRQATIRRIIIPDGIPDYKYVITGKARVRANLSRKDKLEIQKILIGKFQNLEVR
jgi:hypothetical protein